ncbi:MAG: histidine--tRNA ligase [Lachnospiraceae bacterium]|nr:histidine--tRNA ligase [Lachnospiraceae bacterium]
MALLKKPVTGMKDILPREMEIRNYVMDLVRETYGHFGFTQIETPCVEHIENLCSNQGGENEKLIFKIMKRGEKLDIANAKDSSDLSDSGLRYDLTLPLSRYYANHSSELPSPFKALQMGSVFRADRPQKGRFRQFMQCDIDILGDGTSLAEIELVSATTTLLSKLGFKDFTVRISDRRFLKGIASCCGFDESSWDTVFIILDKMDKIGSDGVKDELLKSGFDTAAVDKCMELFRESNGDSAAVLSMKEALGEHLAEGTAESIISIIDSVNASKAGQFNIKFDPTLVRGMSYYTGTIFEIEIAEFGSSIAGGGRYDGMIGRFTGNDVPACGFSIGFERIITMMLDADFKVPSKSDKIAFLVDKKMTSEGLVDVMKQAAELRSEGKTVLVTQMMKNKKFQKDNLEKDGYSDIRDFYNK